VLFSTRFASLETCLLPGVAHPPDGFRPLVGYQDRSVFRHGNSHRTSPHLALRGDESSEEILIHAAGFAFFQWNPDDFAAGTVRAIPRSVLGREQVAAILGRELRAGIERDSQRRAVRLDQNIRHDHLALLVGMRAIQTRVGVSAHIEVRPAVEAAFLH
jgi:hypothetical protein